MKTIAFLSLLFVLSCSKESCYQCTIINTTETTTSSTRDVTYKEFCGTIEDKWDYEESMNTETTKIEYGKIKAYKQICKCNK